MHSGTALSVSASGRWCQREPDPRPAKERKIERRLVRGEYPSYEKGEERNAKKIPLWVQILIGIAIGAIIGVAVPDIVPYISFLGDIFLRLLKMLIAPLVLLTLINGVCKMGDVGMLRKVGVRIVIYYMITSTLASAVA